ncbi:hypothetical protein JCM10908_000570 [Rhodotorula pacifica]|uniref:M50 family metallopeptidase n=1 Tax=Rhodotorula pacifica TaxID=1495444 RepID=UPI0031785CBC
MYIPVADEFGQAVEFAANALVKRAAEGEVEPFTISHTQWVTIYWIEGIVMVYMLCWNLYIARSILFPFKLCAVACHEGCHALLGLLTGAKIYSIILDPNQGGSTRMEGGWAFASLPAGYIGSTLIGAALIFASFDLKASKIAAIPLVVHLVFVAFFARKSRFTILFVSMPIGLVLVLYIVAHSIFLRFLLAALGVMNVMYSVWDQFDDLVFHKINASDVCAFQQEYPWLPAQVWGAIWTSISCAGLFAGVLGGVVLFKKDFTEQYAEALSFIPL